MQVIFKGADQLSVKFEFNTDTDTAEDVVSEMVSISISNKIINILLILFKINISNYQQN